MSTSTGTTSAVPPTASATKDFGRTRTSFGAGPSSSTSTNSVPPAICVRARSTPVTSMALLMSAVPVLAWRRPATSREAYVVANRMRSGACASISVWSACVAGWARNSS